MVDTEPRASARVAGEPREAVAPLLTVESLVKQFEVRGSREKLHAVSEVSFELRPGETLGLVGESGSGKTTLARCVMGLETPTSGQVVLSGKDLTVLSKRRVRRLRSTFQMVFQDPSTALNPRFSVAKTLEENLLVQKEVGRAARLARVREVLDLVKLPHTYLDRFPHQLTGGELQRVCIAKAIATSPSLVVLDEPTSALDISVRADIIALLVELQRELGMSYIFVSHDMTAVRQISHRVAIMYLGKIVEIGPNPDIFTVQRHPYSEALLSSVLYPDPTVRTTRVVLSGEIPSPINRPPGCALHPRCRYATPRCATDVPSLRRLPDEDQRRSACWYPEAVG